MASQILLVTWRGKESGLLPVEVQVLNSWLAYNSVNVKLKVNIKGELDTPRIADEWVPSKEELNRILRLVTPRGRVSIALMAFSGLGLKALETMTEATESGLEILLKLKFAKMVLSLLKYQL